MNSTPEPGVTPNDLDIVINRTFAAPRELVWEMFTDPDHLARWWGPRGFDTRVELHEPTPGGRWRYVMVGPDGQEYPSEGVFREVVAPERFVTSDEFGEDYVGETIRGTVVTALFEPQGSSTKLTLRISHPSREEKRKHEEMGVVGGWNSSFECLEEQLAELFGPEAADREIVIMRTLDAPRNLVWDAWTDPELIKQWWGPDGFTTTTEEMAVERGGLWRHVMHGPDGRDYPDLIEYLDVRPHERLVYRHRSDELGAGDVGFRSTVTFAEVGDQTRLTLRMVFASSEDRERTIEESGAMEGGLETIGRLYRQVQRAAGRQGENMTVAYPSATQTILRRVLNAPRELVFEAFTKPERIRRWWGPRSMELKVCEMDFRVGGTWRFVAETADGTVHPFRGEYLEIDPPERLVQTFIYDVDGARDHPSTETVTLVESGEVTILTNVLEHAPTGACARDTQMEGGASESFDRLEELAQSLVQQGQG